MSTVSRNNRKWFDLWPTLTLQPRSSPSADNLFFETETSEEDDDDDDDDDDEDDHDNEDESDSDDAGCEESGLGLLARFAASALPVSSAPLSLLHDGKHHSRQSTLGKNTTETNKLQVKEEENETEWIKMML